MFKHSILALIVISTLAFQCGQSNKAESKLSMSTLEGQVLPFSDPSNEGGWVLNEELSDEFEGNSIDTSKWFVEGQNGDYYIWKGRAPSQFVPHNVIVEEGKLKLRTQWEPDYAFASESYADGSHDDTYGFHEGQPMPVTAAAVITKKRFLYGYMEVKSKVGNAAITGAFWSIGYEQELDIYEQMGNPKLKPKDNSITENVVRTAVHDWSPPAVRPTKAFGYDDVVPYRVADEFHVYAAEWGPDFLKIFRDGKMTYKITQDELGTDWVLNNPMELWLDSEIFKWIGVPHKEELPVNFEIEYMRVWQKPDANLLARQFYGFEGPMLYEENPRPLDMVPEDSDDNVYQKFWKIDSASSKYLSIIEGEYATGVNSLEFSGFGKNEKLELDTVTAISPEGAIEVSAGDYILSMNVWLDQGRAVEKMHLTFRDAQLVVPIEFDKIARREWVTIEKKISIQKGSSNSDQFKIEIRNSDVPEIKAGRFLIDDISLIPIK